MRTPQEIAEKTVQKMYENDAFSRWMGIEIETIVPGSVRLKMPVRKEMLNGFGVCHGGITFAFADSALAFACNSHGRLSLLLDASISYPAPVKENDLLFADVREESLGNNTAIYLITITREDGRKVAIFKGTVFRTDTEILDL